MSQNLSAAVVIGALRDITNFLNTFHFLFSKKMWVNRAGIHKILVRIANREDPYQTASSEAV